jgi:hypothetical protein
VRYLRFQSSAPCPSPVLPVAGQSDIIDIMKDNTEYIRKQTSELLCRQTVENLVQRNFDAIYCDKAANAADFILDSAANAKTVGMGGSQSVKDLGIFEKLRAKGAKLLIHSDPNLTPDERNYAMKGQQTCDVFVSGINALTSNGEIVNIDGVGNRVSASIFGPGKIILVAGRNKIVNGDIADAIKRIKQASAPVNSLRLSKDTPCAKTGICEDCDSSDRICRVTVIMERKPSRSDITVLVVNEDLGF